MSTERRRWYPAAADAAKAAFNAWIANRSPAIAAALAYYTLFAIAPLLLFAVDVASFFYGSSGSAHFAILLRRFAGPQVALILQQVLAAESGHGAGLAASIFAAVTLLLGASGAFASVQFALNQVWGVQPKSGRGIRGLVTDRLPTFLLLGLAGELLVVSFAVTAIISQLHAAIPPIGAFDQAVAESVNLAVVIALMTLMFALVFRTLPDVEIGWRDVWPGALVTAVLSALGQGLIAVYLSIVGVSTVFGAAGSLVAVLVWLYYSGLEFLFGAEITKVMATRRGSDIRPSPNAETVRLVVGDMPPRAAADRGRTRHTRI